MNLIIGQGAITTTPIQVSNAYRTLTGEKSSPYLNSQNFNNENLNINITQEFISFLLDDLNLVTNLVAQLTDLFKSWVKKLSILRKTGTAQSGDLNNTSWFVGIDSVSNPKYIVVTVVEKEVWKCSSNTSIKKIIQHLLDLDLTPVGFGEITE